MRLGKLLNYSGLKFLICKMISNKSGEIKKLLSSVKVPRIMDWFMVVAV